MHPASFSAVATAGSHKWHMSVTLVIPAVAEKVTRIRSQKSYFESFRAWDESKPSLRRLYTKSLIGGDTTAILGTSDLHIEFPDILKWMKALPSQPGCTLIMANNICTSHEKLESTLSHSTSMYSMFQETMSCGSLKR